MEDWLFYNGYVVLHVYWYIKDILKGENLIVRFLIISERSDAQEILLTVIETRLYGYQF